MISQFQVPQLLRTILPEGYADTLTPRPELMVYNAIHQLTHCTKDAVVNHRESLARRCFLVAGKLFADGDPVVRLLIENSFVYSFSSYFPADRKEYLLLKSMIPQPIFNLYLNQVTAGGC